MSNHSVRVRFAPSPTGSMHVGGIRTALYNYLFARHHGGKMVVRIEDTDVERSDESLAKEQLEDLRWLGIDWDEGPDSPGEFGPYHQSKRLDLYKKYVDELLESGRAYYCFLTEEEIDGQKQLAEERGDPYQITSPYRDYSYQDTDIITRIQNGDKPTVRFKVEDPERVFIFDDLVRGEIKLPAHMVGDFVLMRSDGMPVYNFCCVIDDHSMQISHVFRGEEHLSNTLRQLMLYEALGFETPKFGHLSIILDENRKKLSKRHKAASCADLKELGYVPQGIINYLALLGWSHPRGEEILTRTDLIESFTMERVNASPAVFDIKKLHWLNGQHLREFSPKALWDLIMDHVGSNKLTLPMEENWYEKAMPVIWSECDTLNDGVSLLRRWFDQSHFILNEEAKEVLAWPESKALIKAWLAEISGETFMSADQYKEVVKKIQSLVEVKGKALFMPLRVAMIGQPQGPDLHLLVESLPTEFLIKRAEICIQYE